MNDSSLPAPGSAGAWVLASRPKTLAAAVAPVLVGSACAYAAGGFRLLPALAALAVALLIQIGTNFANDVFDYEKGADTEERLGPTRAVQSGLLTPGQMRWGLVAVFGLALVFGLYLTWVAGWPMLVIGAVSVLSGLAYTGGPFPLGYNGLGDLFVIVFFGFVAVCTTAYVQLLAIPEIAWWASVPVGALATAILVVNNVRDLETDARVGKRTLAVRLGRRGGIAEYALLLAAAYAVPLLLWGLGLAGPGVLLPVLTVGLALRLLGQLGVRHGESLNPVLEGTAKLMVLHGLLFAAGIALGAGS